MSTNLILPGRIVASPPTLEPGVEEFLNVDIIRTQSVDVIVRGESIEEHVLEGAEDTDIVELELENGVKQWVSVAQLREDLSKFPYQRLTDKQELRVPAILPREETTRGIPDLVLKGLKVLRISPAEAVAKETAAGIIDHFENKLKPGPGLYRLPDPLSIGEQIFSASSLDSTAPYLVLIHGTVSTTMGSFGRLSETDEWKALQSRYGKRILTLEHRTLSLSPIQNAIDLATLLPVGAKLHLISHSRGGLVGELLCLRPLTEADLQPFIKAGRDHDVKMLQQLSALLKQKNFQIERFVRIACPARGTILTSQRLDLYLSIILNLIGAIPALQTSFIYTFFKATTLELIKLRTKPHEIPGLEAQMPESPVIHLLNRPGLSTKADLAIIAGDIEGEGFWGSLKTLATDVFYWEDHDLVVNTEAMYGGMGREQGAYYFFDKGADVNHFNYFFNAKTRARILSWLAQPSGKKDDPNFKELKRELLDLKPTDLRGATDLPILFLIPEMMGTHLKDKDERIWLDFKALSLGGLDQLKISNEHIKPDGLVATHYQQLHEYLQLHYEVIPFPYDWRLSTAEEGARLAKAVNIELKKHSKKIQFLAHGMGGLVGRAMIAQNQEQVWDRICERGGRLIMLGTPNLGTFAIPRLLLGREKILRLLDLLDFGHEIVDLVDIVRQYPGMLEMLPEDSNINFFDPACWEDLSSRSKTGALLNPPDSAQLQRAKEWRDKLAKAVDLEHMIYVAGSAPSTPSGLRVDRQGIAFEVTPLGDGRVTYALGQLKGMRTWYMDAQHGDMADYPQAFEALLELLDTGKTNKLLAEAPLRQSDMTSSRILRDEEPLLFPNEEGLVVAALGGEAIRRRVETLLPLRISVAHGNLRQATYPLAVGHYYGDAIVSAEAALDKQLEGRLSERFRMDLYPGPEGTVEVIHVPDCFPPGGMIIGLGEVGTLTPEKVRRGITEAALRHALAVVEQPHSSPSGTWRSAAFSTLLLGTQGGGINVDQSVAAIVQGALEANRALRMQGLWDRVRIDVVEFIELYEDTAIQAIHAATNLAERLHMDLEVDESIDVLPYLRVLEGGRFQRPANEYVTGWWRRLQITCKQRDDQAESTGDLHFLTLTDRARAEETLRSTQRPLIDRFIAEAVRSPSYNENIASTLFELLIPNPVKDQARDEADLVLIVDSEAAQYPWELLAERTRKGVRPLATSIGIIRQFKTSDFRRSPQPPRDKNALVLGDTQSGYADLPGAQAEAESVAQVLQSEGYDVNKIIKAEALKVVSELFAKEYKIIHLAGHGVYNVDNPLKSGMVLGENIFLTTAELGQLRVVPELVFINCCHLGRIDKELQVKLPHKMAASIAQELINMGVKAVIAAGWAVDDAAASTFATTFYEAILKGLPFGSAVTLARKRIFDRHHNTNTWGAYQCYGNPGFILVQEPEAVAGKSPRYFSRREYFDKLKSIAADAKGAEADRRDMLRQNIRQLSGSIPAHWRDGEVLAAFARAWAELGDFNEAIENYRKAILEPKAGASLSTIEQLANLQDRYASRLHAERQTQSPTVAPVSPSQTYQDPDKLIKEATQWLEWLSKLGDTTERLSLLGSLYKRLALATTDQERLNMLKKAKRYYGKAHEDAIKETNVLDPYPTLNWVTIRFLLSDKKRDELLGLINEAKKVTMEKVQQEPTFWNRIGKPDSTLLCHLVRGDLASHEQEVAELYRTAIASGPTEREVSSVRDHLNFLIDMLDAPEQAATVKALEKIKTALGV